MSNSVKCIIRQEWENRDADGWIIERSGYVYVTNEDGTPHVYDSIKDARAEIRANFGRDANKSGILHTHSVDEYSGHVHDGYIFIVREDTQEYAEAIEQAEQDAAPEYIEPEAIQTVSGHTIYRSTDPVTSEIVFTVAGRDFWTLAEARYYAQCNPMTANAAELEQRAEILAAIEAPALREYFTAEATAHQWTPEETRSAIEHRESIIKANAAALALLDAYADASGDTLTEDDDETHAAYMVARDEITGTAARATDHDRALVAGMTQTIADAVAYMQPLAVASATADRFCEAYDDATGNLTAAAYDAAQAVARAEIAGGHATGTDYAWISQMVEAIAADAAHRAALAGYADIPWLVWPEDDDPRSREPYQRYELEAFLGEPDDYDVDAIEAEATAYDPATGRTVWAQGIDLAAIAERHQIVAYYPATA